jgi:hypothetical protein
VVCRTEVEGKCDDGGAAGLMGWVVWEKAIWNETCGNYKLRISYQVLIYIDAVQVLGVSGMLSVLLCYQSRWYVRFA